MKKVIGILLTIFGAIFLYFIVIVGTSMYFLPKKDGAVNKVNKIVEKAVDEATKNSTENETENKEENKEEDDKFTIEIGKKLEFKKFTVEITGYKIIKTYNGKEALKIIYDFTNTSDEEASANFSLKFNAYQDGVETDNVLLADDLNRSTGNKKAKPGACVKNCEDAVGIDDMSKPLRLELSKWISIGKAPYTGEIDLSKIK